MDNYIDIYNLLEDKLKDGKLLSKFDTQHLLYLMHIMYVYVFGKFSTIEYIHDKMWNKNQLAPKEVNYLFIILDKLNQLILNELEKRVIN